MHSLIFFALLIYYPDFLTLPSALNHSVSRLYYTTTNIVPLMKFLHYNFPEDIRVGSIYPGVLTGGLSTHLLTGSLEPLSSAAQAGVFFKEKSERAY